MDLEATVMNLETPTAELPDGSRGGVRRRKARLLEGRRACGTLKGKDVPRVSAARAAGVPGSD